MFTLTLSLPDGVVVTLNFLIYISLPLKKPQTKMVKAGYIVSEKMYEIIKCECTTHGNRQKQIANGNLSDSVDL